MRPAQSERRQSQPPSRCTVAVLRASPRRPCVSLCADLLCFFSFACSESLMTNRIEARVSERRNGCGSEKRKRQTENRKKTSSHPSARSSSLRLICRCSSTLAHQHICSSASLCAASTTATTTTTVATHAVPSPSPLPAVRHRCLCPSPPFPPSCSESVALAPPTPSVHSQPSTVQLRRQHCRDEVGAVCSGRDPPLLPCRCRCPSACCTSAPHSALPV